MKTKNIYAWMAAMTLAACSTNDIADITGNDGDNVVNVASATRAAANNDAAIKSFHLVNITQLDYYDTKFEADYTYDANTTSWVAENGQVLWCNIKDDNDGRTTNYFEAFTPLYTPENNASYVSFTQPSDQSTAALLEAADWMTADTHGKKEEGGITLKFDHKLSKLHFDVNAKADATAMGSSDFKVINSSITPYYNNTSTPTTIEAIVNPRETAYTSNDELINITLGSETFSLKFPSDITFAPGKQYNFTLNLGHDAVSISSVSVTDWTSATITTNDDQAFNDSGIDYVTFSADSEQGFKFVVTIDNVLPLPIEGFEYSVNNGPWIAIPGTGMTDFVTFGGNKGKLRLRGKSIDNTGTCRKQSDGLIYEGHATVKFENEVKVDCSGDIRTLIDYENHFVATNNARFMYLFKNCPQLTSAPKLPATDLADNCYFMMFGGCTSLATAPELPATDLADGCYANMFEGCKSLTKAPELPATKLAYGCYYFMFSDCSALTTAPEELPAKELANSCYNGMFCGCTSLTSAPQLPATELANSCYWRMFDGCTLLASPPELPATTLAYSCYYMMFRDCTSLTKAPELPAQTLDTQCYKHIFEGCKKISEIKMLAPPSEIYNNNNMDGWLYYVGTDESVTSRTLILDSQDAYDALKRHNLLRPEWQATTTGATVVDKNGNAITDD